MILTGLVLVAGAVRAEPVEVLFEDQFETAAEAGVSAPPVGSYASYSARLSELSEADFHTGGAAATGKVLQLNPESRRCIARLDRPAMPGEHVRVELDAKLDYGSSLMFGLGSKGAGVPMGKGHFFSIIVSLMSDGGIAVYKGTEYERVPDVEQRPAQWAHYTLDYVVGAEEFSLKVGDGSTIVSGPFTEQGMPLQTVEEIFLSTGSDKVAGEFDNVKVSVANEAFPAP